MSAAQTTKALKAIAPLVYTYDQACTRGVAERMRLKRLGQPATQRSPQYRERIGGAKAVLETKLLDAIARGVIKGVYDGSPFLAETFTEDFKADIALPVQTSLANGKQQEAHRLRTKARWEALDRIRRDVKQRGFYGPPQIEEKAPSK